MLMLWSRDQIRENVLVKQYYCDVDIAHLISYNEELAHKLTTQPADIIPLVRPLVPIVWWRSLMTCSLKQPSKNALAASSFHHKKPVTSPYLSISFFYIPPSPRFPFAISTQQTYPISSAYLVSSLVPPRSLPKPQHSTYNVEIASTPKLCL